MSRSIISALAEAAETRRREMPASVALVILTGGLAAAIMDGSAPVGWAAIMSLLLILDTELYRRLDAAETRIEGPVLAGLCAWAFFSSSFYAILPLALWLDGEAAGAAAAMVLWVAGVVRHLSPGVSGAPLVALSGSAPPAISLLASPLLISAMTAQPDWDLAVIAAVGGGALMAYVTQARASAAEAERALREAARTQTLQHTLAQLVFNQAKIAALLVDREGRVIAISRGMEAGLSVDGAIGRKFEDVIPWSPDRWRDALARALAGEHVHYDEDEVRTADGVLWFEWEALPWRNEHGEICGVLTQGRQITSLIRARAAAAENEQRLKIALEAGHSVVWEVDAKTRQITWYGDPKPLYGGPISYDEFMDGTTPILHADDRSPLMAYFESIAAGRTGCVEHRVLRSDGEVRWAEVWARPVMGRSGGLRKFIILSKDITDRKRQEAAFIAAMHRTEEALKAKRALFGDAPTVDAAEPIDEAAVNVEEMFERLDGLIAEVNARDAVLAETMISLRAAREAAEAANLSKSQFLTSMSHELRTPLNAIIGYSEILQEEAAADGRDSDLADIERVLNAARQLLHLINDILDLSKIEAGRMDISVSNFDLAGLIKDASATVRPSVEKNRNTLRVDIDQDLGEACTDSFKLNQCLLNLLANAAKFTSDGEIALRAKRERLHNCDWIEIAVADTGIGMTEEQVAKLFQAFVQADVTTARRYGGTGLGLVLTRRMMQMLDGEVSVASAPGRGSIFTLRFPATLRLGPAPAKAEAATAQNSGGARTVLLIDDEESARDLTARSLARLGFEVKTAVTGEQGIAMARQLDPSLILLDINLPDLTGWEVLDRLRADGLAHVPVIVHSIDDNRQRALSAGASEHLVKPADRDVLAAAVLRFARAQTPAAAPSLKAKTA
jgi:PAS domain S-box-containing protein